MYANMQNMLPFLCCLSGILAVTALIAMESLFPFALEAYILSVNSVAGGRSLTKKTGVSKAVKLVWSWSLSLL